MGDLPIPNSLNYHDIPKPLPPNTIKRSVVIRPSNNSSFTDNAIIQLDSNTARGYFLDPGSMYIRYNLSCTSTQASGTAFLRGGTPYTMPFSLLQVFCGSQLVENIQSYNLLTNMLINLKMNVAQKIGAATNFGYLGQSAAGTLVAPTFSNVNGCQLITNSTGYVNTLKLSGPLPNILSNSQKLLPLWLMGMMRVQLTLDTLANMTASGSTTSGMTLTNVELCYDLINFGDDVATMVEQSYPKILIKSSSWNCTTIPFNAVTSPGQFSLVYNVRLASIKSLFFNFGVQTATSNLVNGL